VMDPLSASCSSTVAIDPTSASSSSVGENLTVIKTSSGPDLKRRVLLFPHDRLGHFLDGMPL